jgi:hypothetical protein
LFSRDSIVLQSSQFLTAVVDTVVWRILDQIGLPESGCISLGRTKGVRENVRAEKIEDRRQACAWLIAFGVHLLRAWERTLRYEVDDRAGIVGKPVTENYIGALWHNRLLIFPLFCDGFFQIVPERH